MKKNRAQLLKPDGKRWMKIDTKTGLIIAFKKTPGPYKNIKRRG